MEDQNKKYNYNNSTQGSLLFQMAVLFSIATLMVGAFVMLSQQVVAEKEVKNQIEIIASQDAEEVEAAIKEYPANEWLLTYWHRHWNDMDIEYDVDYTTGAKTREKANKLMERYPGMQIKYVTEEEAKALPAEDQKRFAEVVYSWLLTRVNQIKKAQNAAFVFCVMSDDKFDHQFFVFSGAKDGAKRGTSYEDAYILGVQVDVNESQHNSMKAAMESDSFLADAGNYMDFYSYVGRADGMNVLIGMTYDISVIMERISQRAWRGTLFAVMFQVMLAIICLILLHGFGLKPLKKVQENIRIYMETKHSEVVRENLDEISANNEIGQLSKDVSALAVEIDNYLKRIGEITAEKERINAELDLATRIQRSMLPSTFPPFPKRNDVDLYASMDPAKEVGGDFYDYYFVDDDHLCLVIADVSGKGVPAALFMMASKLVIKNNAMMGKSPAKILEDANETICASNHEDMFVTVWVGILEMSTGKLIASNAGHEYPTLYRPDEGFELMKDQHSFMVGGMNGVTYKEYELQLEPNSKLFLYTDGVPEATDKDNNMFGVERMVDALNEVDGQNPEDILKHIRKSVDDFVQGAEQFDDLTMLCVEYKGN